MERYASLLRPRVGSVETPAPFGRRALALIADVLVLDLIVTAPFTPVLAPLIARVETGSLLAIAYSVREAAAIALLFTIALAYFALFEYVLGQTPGMMLLDTRVRTRPTLLQSLGRNLFLIPVGPLILLWVVEPILAAVTRHTLLERVTGTRTVRTQYVPV